MTELLRLLSLYYACDQIAAQRPLSSAEVAACMDHYTAVKSHFSEPQDTNVDAYLRFKAWEQANPAMVAQIRQRSAG